MGCWLTKTQLGAAVENQAFEEADKSYSWDKREPVNPADYTIEQVHSGEVGRTPGSVGGQPFVVRDCSNSAIFLLDHLNTVTIDDCTNCTIVLGPTSGSVFVRECSECVVVVACGQFRTRDCRQLDVRLLCNTQPIIEASTRVRLSCYQLYYPQLADQFKASGLSIFNNNWSEVHDFTPTDGEKNWSVVMPAVLSLLQMPATPPLCSVGLSTSRKQSTVPFTLGSASPPGHRCLQDEPLLVLVYHSPQQTEVARGIIDGLNQEAGLSAVLYSRSVHCSASDATRVLGSGAATDAAPRLAAGPVVALLVDAPYHHIEQAVSSVRADQVYVAPNNGNGYNQANNFFAFASLSMSI